MQNTDQSDNQRIFEILRYIVEFIPDAVFAVDSEKVIIAWNRIMEKMTGIKREEVIGQNLEPYVIAVYGRPRRTLIDLVLDDGTSNERYYNTVREEGSVSGDSFIPWVYGGKGAHLWAKASSLRDDSGNIIGAIETIRDLTERKNAETLLRENEQKQRNFIEMLRDVVYTTDRDGKLTYLSPIFEEITGYPCEDIIGRPFADIVSPQCRESALQFFNTVVGTEETTSYDVEIRAKNGEIIPVAVRGAPLFAADGALIGRIGVARDITERKQAEEALEESEANYRQLFENSPAGIYQVDFKTGEFLKTNDVFREYLGYSQEELNSLSPYDILAEESRGLFLERLEKMARGEEVPETVEYEIVNKQGKRFCVHLHSKNVYDAEGYLVALDIVAHDITELKKVEKALRESEERYRMIAERMTDIVWIADMNLRTLYVTPSIETMLGFTPEERMLQTVDQQLTPDSLACGMETLARELTLEEENQGDPQRKVILEMEYYHKDGSTRWMEAIMSGIRDEQGVLTGLYGVSRDITDRKRVEEELKESERLYRTIFSTTGTATVIVEEDTTLSLVNTEFEKLSGYSKEEIEGKKRWTDFVHEEDLEWMIPWHQKRRGTDPSVPRNYEFRFLNREGSVKYVLLTVEMIYETGKRVASLLDLTERRQSEMLTKTQRDLAAKLNKLTRLNDVLKACGETALQLSQMDCGGVYLVDEEAGGLKLIYHKGLSHEFVDQISYYPEDSPNARLVEKGDPVYCRYQDLLDNVDLPGVNERLRSIAIVPIHHEGRAIACLNVASRTMEEISDFTRTALESITSQVGAAIARVKAEEALRKSEEMFRTLAENSSDTIMRFDRQCRHLYASPRAEQETGIPSQAFTGKTHRELGFPEDLIELWEGAIRKVFETRQSNRIEFMLPSAIWIDWLLVPEFDENGEVKAVMTSARDITDRKHQEDYEQEEKERLKQENLRLRSSIKDRWRLGAIIGKSAVMQEVYDLIQRAAEADVSVIVYGESGTGKELVARAIHDMSSRKDGEFVSVNCGAIPENLLESEFFGYRRGAFTGAHIDKHGYLDLADRGSLFLDEIGELGMNIQVKLLRALEGGGYTPLGNARTKHSDFRIIAATNRDLVDHVKQGIMRKDFFYRIHIVPITLPPLRERREDIPLLIEHVLANNGNGSKAIQIPGKIMEALYYYDWPGNVRELQNVLHRYLTIKSLGFMSASSLGSEAVPGYAEDEDDEGCTDLIMALERYEKGFIMRTLEQNKWHRIKAAKALGISRHTLFRKMKNYELI